MGDSLKENPPTDDTEAARSISRPAIAEVTTTAPDSVDRSAEVRAEAPVAVAQEAMADDVALSSDSRAAMPASQKLNLPEPLNTRKVLARGSYASSQVGLLISKYSRIRNNLLVVSRSGLVGERYTYAERVADYLLQAKQELEGSRPNLPVTASLLSGADRSLVWLNSVRILYQRSQIALDRLAEINPPPRALIDNLLEAQDVLRQGARFPPDSEEALTASEALRSALEDALSRTDELDRQDVVEEDLQVRRLQTLIAYLLFALLLLLAAIPFTTQQILDPARREIIWPVWTTDFSRPVNLVIAALGLAAIGAVGGIVSGMLKVRDSRASLTSYRASLLNLALKPLVGAVAALVLYTFLSWNVIKGLEVSSPGVFVLTAFLAGFSERYFLKVVGAAESETRDSESSDRSDKQMVSVAVAGEQPRRAP